MSSIAAVKQNAYQVIETPSSFAFERLPTEILSLFFQYSGPVSTLNQWSHVCKRLKSVSEDQNIWKFFCLTHPLFTSSLVETHINYRETYRLIECTFVKNIRKNNFKVLVSKYPESSLFLCKAGRYFVFLLSDGKIAFFHPLTHQVIRALDARSFFYNKLKIRSIAFSSAYFAIAYSDGVIEVWEAKTWEKLSEFRPPPHRNSANEVMEMEIFGDALYFLTHFRYFAWNIKDRALFSISFFQGKPHLESTFPADQRENLPKLGSLSLIVEVAVSMGFSKCWTTAQAKLNEKLQVLGDSDGKVFFWDMAQNTIKTICSAGVSILSLNCNDELGYIAFYAGETLYFFSLKDQLVTHSMHLPSGYISSFTWQNSHAFVGTSEGKIFKVDLAKTSKSALVYDFKKNAVVSQAWNLTKLYVSSGRGVLQILDFGIQQ
jgi:hypothetical protein